MTWSAIEQVREAMGPPVSGDYETQLRDKVLAALSVVEEALKAAEKVVWEFEGGEVTDGSYVLLENALARAREGIKP